MNAPRKLWRWIVNHPFRSSLAVMFLVATPGYVRLEATINEAHQAADSAQHATDRLEELVRERERDRIERREELCQRDVDDRADARAMWVYVLDVLLQPPTDKVIAARSALDEILPVLECTADAVPEPAG